MLAGTPTISTWPARSPGVIVASTRAAQPAFGSTVEATGWLRSGALSCVWALLVGDADALGSVEGVGVRGDALTDGEGVTPAETRADGVAA